MARNVGEKKKIDGRRKIQRKIKKKKKKIKKSERKKEKNIYSRGSVKRFSFYARFFLFFSFLFLFFFFFFSPPLFLQCPRNNAISSPLYLFFFPRFPARRQMYIILFFFSKHDLAKLIINETIMTIIIITLILNDGNKKNVT